MTRQYLFVGVTIGVCATLVVEQLRFNHFDQPAVAEQPSDSNEEKIPLEAPEPVRLIAQAAPAPLRKSVPSRQANPNMRGILDRATNETDNSKDPFGSTARPESNSNPALVKLADPSDSDLEALAPAETTEEETATLNELREQFCALARTRSEQLNAQALTREIEKLQREIANLNAARKLFEAQQTLQNMIEQFPNSPAAERAKSMLAPKPAPVINRPGLQPIPDPGFSQDRG